jgi:hypothetical protein
VWKYRPPFFDENLEVNLQLLRKLIKGGSDESFSKAGVDVIISKYFRPQQIYTLADFFKNSSGASPTIASKNLQRNR